MTTEDSGENFNIKFTQALYLITFLRYLNFT